MRINRVSEGKFSEVKLEDGKRIFVSVLPDRITASTMFLAFPKKKIWEFVFPFYIRTAVGAWDSSKTILRLTLEAIKDAKSYDDLLTCLERDAARTLRGYIEDCGEQAIDKVGKDFDKVGAIIEEYGEVLEKVNHEAMKQYPALVYPQSLLPYPKEAIREALESGLGHPIGEDMREQIKVGIVCLDYFVEDGEANKRNSEIARIMSDARDILRREEKGGNK